MSFLIHLLIWMLDIYMWAIIIAVMASWLVAFDVLNTRNRGVYKACQILNRLTWPPIAFLKRYVRPVGGLDLTPMIVIFGIYLAQAFLYSLLGSP